MNFPSREPAPTTLAAEEIAQPPPLLATADDLAAALRISRRTVFRMRARGELPPPVELSRHLVRWLWSDVCDYVASLKDRRGMGYSLDDAGRPEMGVQE